MPSFITSTLLLLTGMEMMLVTHAYKVRVKIYLHQMHCIASAHGTASNAALLAALLAVLCADANALHSV